MQIPQRHRHIQMHVTLICAVRTVRHVARAEYGE